MRRQQHAEAACLREEGNKQKQHAEAATCGSSLRSVREEGNRQKQHATQHAGLFRKRRKRELGTCGSIVGKQIAKDSGAKLFAFTVTQFINRHPNDGQPPALA